MFVSFSMVLDTTSNGRYRQTSKEINANANALTLFGVFFAEVLLLVFYEFFLTNFIFFSSTFFDIFL